MGRRLCQVTICVQALLQQTSAAEYYAHRSEPTFTGRAGDIHWQHDILLATFEDLTGRGYSLGRHIQDTRCYLICIVRCEGCSAAAHVQKRRREASIRLSFPARPFLYDIASLDPRCCVASTSSWKDDRCTPDPFTIFVFPELSIFTMYIWTLLLVQAALVRSVTFTLGCVRYPSVCNHRCYSVFVAGRPQTVTWDAPTGATKTARRTAAGAIPNPCCGRIAAPAACFDTNGGTVPFTSPDEYPYASTLESVSTSPIIRCTGEEENVEEGRNFGSLTQLNTAEGGCGRRGPCSINIAFSFLTAEYVTQTKTTNLRANARSSTPFCNAGGAGLPNDGFEFTLAGGTFVPARRSKIIYMSCRMRVD